jgi:hypothetical protein
MAVVVGRCNIDGVLENWRCGAASGQNLERQDGPARFSKQQASGTKWKSWGGCTGIGGAGGASGGRDWLGLASYTTLIPHTSGRVELMAIASTPGQTRPSVATWLYAACSWFPARRTPHGRACQGTCQGTSPPRIPRASPASTHGPERYSVLRTTTDRIGFLSTARRKRQVQSNRAGHRATQNGPASPPRHSRLPEWNCDIRYCIP